jgi:hypothetical protein
LVSAAKQMKRKELSRKLAGAHSGGTLLVILAVGLLHYSAWKFVEAFIKTV